MSISKKISLLVVQFLSCAVCIAQKENIDSLKKILITAKGIERINCLNTLSNGYYYKQKPDSVLFYASQAFAEAEKINYVQGMADAMFYKGKIENNLGAQEQYFLKAISLYLQCNNVDTLGQVYFRLGQVLNQQAKFSQAIIAYKMAEQLYIRAKDLWNLGVTYTFTDLAYASSGDFENAFEYGYRALQSRQKNNEHDGVLWSLCNLASLFQEAEDYPTAIDYYYHQTLEYANKNGLNWRPYYDKISECWWGMHQKDSALYYMQKYFLGGNSDASALLKRLADTSDMDFSIGKLHLIKNEYDEALKIFLYNMRIAESKYERVHLMETLGYIGETYLRKMDYSNALFYAQKLSTIARGTGARHYIRDGTKQLWEVYDHLQSVDSAYKYYRQYVSMRDSVSNYRFISQMTSFKEAAAKEKRELQYSQELERQSLIRKVLIGGILFFIFLALIIFRNVSLKRKNERLEKEGLKNELNVQRLESEYKQSELQQQKTEVEMQALRAQMNPHFIFNSLNSINRFILQNERLQASEYLTKFSKLVRMVLQNSQSSLIPLESELESLGLYLEMEALRFNHHFEYKISVPKDLDIEILKVPPLILQPYVENAIWHGLMHKEEKGQLNIDVSEEDGFLYFRIADNGIGRKKASEIAGKSATKHKSMGLKITANRIAMLQNSKGEESPVKINDLVNPDGTAAGTEIIIKMPVIEGE
jgi:tetratricopeptide (TPR) repeat protein